MFNYGSYCINNKYKHKQNTSFCAKPIQPEIGQAMKNRLLSVKSIDIYAHAASDTDSDEATVFMYDWCKAHGIKVSICTDKSKMNALGIDPKDYKVKRGYKPAEMALLLDHNGWDKVAKSYKKLLEKTKLKMTIDHHPETDVTIDSFKYIDVKAKSCCAILYRFIQSIDEKLTTKNAKNLLYGIGSDFHKSKRIKFENTPIGSKAVRLEILNNDKNSTEVLDAVEGKLSKKQVTKIYSDLDIISHLTPKEQEFRNEIFSKVSVTPNGKMAYVIIDTKDPKWKDLGMDNLRTSTILRDLRLRLIGDVQADEMFTAEQKAKFAKADIQGAIVMYPVIQSSKKPKAYQISLHSKSGTGYTKKWREYAKQAYIKKEMERANSVKYEFVGDGHDDRSGGRIFTYDKSAIKSFIGSFLEAGQNVE